MTIQSDQNTFTLKRLIRQAGNVSFDGRKMETQQENSLIFLSANYLYPN